MGQPLQSRGERAFSVVNAVFLGALALLIFYPFYYMLIYSLNVGESSKAGLYLWPTDFTWDNYRTLFKTEYFVNAYAITVLRTVVGTVAHVAFTGLVAYGLADGRLLFRRAYTVIFIIPMFFSGGLIPFYLLIVQLGLIDSFWVYIIPAVFSVWNMILMRTYFQSLPTSLEESARLDGASDLRIFFRIIVPISAPVLAAITLFAAVGQWNSWFDAFLYVNNPRLHPIQLFLKSVIQQTVGVKNLLNALASSGLDAKALEQLERIKMTTESLKAAATVVTIGPIIAIYPSLQKYFVKGVMLGSLKG
jgi:putative aldouronate transport system permease protein